MPTKDLLAVCTVEDNLKVHLNKQDTLHCPKHTHVYIATPEIMFDPKDVQTDEFYSTCSIINRSAHPSRWVSVLNTSS